MFNRKILILICLGVVSIVSSLGFAIISTEFIPQGIIAFIYNSSILFPIFSIIHSIYEIVSWFWVFLLVSIFPIDVLPISILTSYQIWNEFSDSILVSAINLYIEHGNILFFESIDYPNFQQSGYYIPCVQVFSIIMSAFLDHCLYFQFNSYWPSYDLFTTISPLLEAHQWIILIHALNYILMLGLISTASVIWFFFNYILIVLEFFVPIDYSTWDTSYWVKSIEYVRSLSEFFMLKFLGFISFVVIIRSGTPRYRFDYLTKLGWLKFLGFSLAVLLFIIILYFLW